MLIAVLGMALSLSLNFFMVPRYGAQGAAVSSVVTYSIMAVTCFLLVRKFYLLKHE